MRHFAGNSLAAFSRTSPSTAEVTTAGWFDSDFVSSAISVGGGQFVITPDFSASGTVWVRFDLRTAAAGASNQNAFAILYNSGLPCYRVITPAASTAQLQYWNGSAWTNCGSAATSGLSTNARFTVVLKIVLGTSMEMFVGGASVVSGSGISGGEAAVTSVRLSSVNSSLSAPSGISQVMVADYDLRDSHVLDPALNGNSATHTGGTGAYTAINETVLDESTSVTVAASGNKHGQTFADITVPAGYVIGAMVVNARGRVAGTITDGKLGVRGSGGTDSSGSGLSFNGGYEPRCRIVEDDPDTATRWTQSGFNAAEIYEEAV